LEDDLGITSCVLHLTALVDCIWFWSEVVWQVLGFDNITSGRGFKD